MNDAAVRLGRLGIAFIVGSVAVWILLLILIPHLMLLDYAFHANPGAIRKGIAPEGFSLYSFLPLVDPNDDLAFNTFVRTLLTSGVITVLALGVCYPIAYYLAKVAVAKWLHILMLCLLVPFWVNEVLRAYAWRTLMARQGLLNQLVTAMGFEPIEFFNYELPILDAGAESPSSMATSVTGPLGRQKMAVAMVPTAMMTAAPVQRIGLGVTGAKGALRRELPGGASRVGRSFSTSDCGGAEARASASKAWRGGSRPAGARRGSRRWPTSRASSARSSSSRRRRAAFSSWTTTPPSATRSGSSSSARACGSAPPRTAAPRSTAWPASRRT